MGGQRNTEKQLSHFLLPCQVSSGAQKSPGEGKTCSTRVPHLSGASSEEFLTNLWEKDKIIKELTLGCELLTCALSSVEQETCKRHHQTRYLLVGADTLQLPSKWWENIPYHLRLLKLQQIEHGLKKQSSWAECSYKRDGGSDEMSSFGFPLLILPYFPATTSKRLLVVSTIKIVSKVLWSKWETWLTQ